MSPINTLVFTDTNIDRNLLESLDSEAKIIVLDSIQNSLEQFTAALSEYTDIAVAIVRLGQAYLTARK